MSRILSYLSYLLSISTKLVFVLLSEKVLYRGYIEFGGV